MPINTTQKYFSLVMLVMCFAAMAEVDLQPIQSNATTRPNQATQTTIFSVCYQIGVQSRNHLTHSGDILNQLKQANATATPKESLLIAQLGQTIANGLDNQIKALDLCTQLIKKDK